MQNTTHSELTIGQGAEMSTGVKKGLATDTLQLGNEVRAANDDDGEETGQRAAPRSTIPPARTRSTVPPPQNGPHRRSGSWAIVQRFVHDGFRYQVRRQPVGEENAFRRLTARETQVIELVYDGSSNKEAAYTLGLAPSTVGVLLSRAAAKLGASSRQELIAAYTRLRAEQHDEAE